MPPRHLISILILLNLLHACTAGRSYQQAINLKNCDFRVQSVEKINLAGVAIQNVSDFRDLPWGEAGTLLAGIATSSTFPLTFQLNVEGRNPNREPAGLHKLEYIVLIDDEEMTAGILEHPFTIAPGSSLVIPLSITIDLKRALQGKSLDAMLNFGFNLAGVGKQPSRITLKLKPTILVGKRELNYPGYLTIRQDFSGR